MNYVIGLVFIGPLIWLVIAMIVSYTLFGENDYRASSNVGLTAKIATLVYFLLVGGIIYNALVIVK